MMPLRSLPFIPAQKTQKMATALGRTFARSIAANVPKPARVVGGAGWGRGMARVGFTFGAPVALYLTFTPSRPLLLNSLASPTPATALLTPPLARNDVVDDEEAMGDPALPDGPAVSFSHLSFSTVLGISTGIFVKKGLKTIAFILGGVFVLVQYLHSRNYLTTSFPSWTYLNNKYESTFDSLIPPDQNKSNRLARLVNAFLDFLLADFPGRATFAMGFMVGLRM